MLWEWGHSLTEMPRSLAHSRWPLGQVQQTDSKHCQATAVGGWGLLTSFPAVPSWGIYLPVLMLAILPLHQGRLTAVPSLGHSWIVCIHDHFSEPNFKIQFQKGMYHLSSRFCPLYLKPSICPINTYRSKKTKKKNLSKLIKSPMSQSQA